MSTTPTPLNCVSSTRGEVYKTPCRSLQSTIVNYSQHSSSLFTLYLIFKVLNPPNTLDTNVNNVTNMSPSSFQRKCQRHRYHRHLHIPTPRPDNRLDLPGRHGASLRRPLHLALSKIPSTQRTTKRVSYHPIPRGRLSCIRDFNPHLRCQRIHRARRLSVRSHSPSVLVHALRPIRRA